MQRFLKFLDSGIGTVVVIKYPGTVQIIFIHIFSREIENFPFLLNPRGLSTEGTLDCDGEKFQGDRQYIFSAAFCRKFSIRGRNCATDVLPLLFWMLFPGPLSRQQKSVSSNRTT